MSGEIKPVNPKGNQPWIFIGRTDAKAETPILWPPDAKNWLIGKDPDAWKDWRQEEKGITKNEVVEWYHRLNGHESEQALGVCDGQGGLACCSPRGSRVGHDWVTELSECLGTYPVVQWLRIHLVVWGMWVWSLVGKLGSHMLRRTGLHTTNTESPWATMKTSCMRKIVHKARKISMQQDIYIYR